MKQKLFAISVLEDLSPVEVLAEGATEKPRRMVFYAGANIYRYDWFSDTEYMLRFDMSPGAVDLTRLNLGAPLMADHQSPRSVDRQVGIVEKAWLEGNRGIAEFRLSNTPDLDNFRAKVEQKIYRNVSMEAAIELSALKDETPKGSKMKHLLATRWNPQAISFVPSGADPSAQLLAEDDNQAVWLAEGLYQPRIKNLAEAGAASQQQTLLALLLQRRQWQ